jgi:hypothetical protein
MNKLNKSNKQWSGKKIYTMIKDGELNLDLSIQRDLVWDVERKSLLIHSLIYDFPVPALFVVKRGEQHDVTDGKQRADAVAGYISDDYALDLDPEYQEVEMKNGDILNINGKKFSELSEELQDCIKDFSFTVYWFDNIESDIEEEIFFRLNNGKSLTPVEQAMSKSKSRNIIWNLSCHELMQMINKRKGKRQSAVIKAYATIFNNDPSYTSPYLKKIALNVEITPEQVSIIGGVFDKILGVYKSLMSTNEKVAKRIIKETHLMSLTKLASQITSDELGKFVSEFFGGKSTTISNIYNSNSQHGSAKPESVARRLTAIKDSYENEVVSSQTDAKIEEIKAQAVATTQKPVVMETTSEGDVDPDFDSSLPSLEDIEKSLYGKEEAEVVESV